MQVVKSIQPRSIGFGIRLLVLVRQVTRLGTAIQHYGLRLEQRIVERYDIF